MSISISKVKSLPPLPPTPPPSRPLPPLPSKWDTYEASRRCEDERCAEPQSRVWHCVLCARSYCSCWDVQGPHRARRGQAMNRMHERTEPLHAERIDSVLNPDPDTAQRLHSHDQTSKWIGLARDARGHLILEEYGRFDTLCSRNSPQVRDGPPCYPQLVSFVGETNAGKSTLIKLLITGHANSPSVTQDHITPVTGTAANEMEPTSGDIHLYPDPGTYKTQRPILFVDTEGLRGGDRTPLGARMRWSNEFSPSFTRGQVRARPIAWARTDQGRGRQDAVHSIYPRLLYAFSDCVIFVLRNSKTAEAALTALLEWGETAAERSINQLSLPHCILVLNDVRYNPSDPEWEPGNATRTFFSTLDKAPDWVDHAPKLHRLREHWRSIGHEIHNMADLLHCYYSTFHVVRIPGSPAYEGIHRQTAVLRNIIAASCESAFAVKQACHGTMSTAALSSSLQSALDHYAAHLRLPFNFKRMLESHSPSDARLHVLRLFATLGQSMGSTRSSDRLDRDISQCFRSTIPLLASASLLDLARRRTGQEVEFHSRYHESYVRALDEYLHLHHPCSYQEGTRRRCQLVQARHRSQGHQDEEGFFRAGSYETSVNLRRWLEDLQYEIDDSRCRYLVDLERGPWSPSSTEGQQIAWTMHLENVKNFFDQIPDVSIFSHATCFCCLLCVPEHLLKCGHGLCTACIKSIGTHIGSAVRISSCPLHCRSATRQDPTIVAFTPLGAGVRVLTLDGGGTRAILQLELLSALQQVLRELGGHIPICSLFDLIVGSGTGALNAALLEVLEDQVDARDVFTNLCQLVFDRRWTTKLPAWFGKRKRYSAARLTSVLKTTFHERKPLFRYKDDSSRGTRVAMVCPSWDGTATAVLANYRRPEAPQEHEHAHALYDFERVHEPANEPMIWESIARCVASQFEPMMVGGRALGTHATDVMIQSSVTVAKSEIALMGASTLDIMVSLSTGQRERSSGAGLLRRRFMRTMRSQSASADDQAWERILRADPVGAGSRRYIRFNDSLGDDVLPEDDCNEIVRVGNRMRQVLIPRTASIAQTDLDIAAQSLRRRLQYLAYRLIAACFYISADDPATDTTHERRPCEYRVLCRFTSDSDEMVSLRRIVQRHHVKAFEPHFVLWPDCAHVDYSVRMPLEVSSTAIEPSYARVDRVHVGEFASCSLFLCAHDALAPDGLPISGTPQRRTADAADDVTIGRTSSNRGSCISTSSALTEVTTITTGSREALIQPSTCREPPDWDDEAHGASGPKVRRPDARPPLRIYSSSRHAEWLNVGTKEGALGYDNESVDDMIDFVEDWLI